MAQVTTKIQVLAGRKPAVALSPDAPAQAASPATESAGLQLLQFKDTLALTAATVPTAPATPTARVAAVGPLSRAAAAKQANPAATAQIAAPTPAAPTPAAPTPAPAPGGKPGYRPVTASARVDAKIANAADADAAFKAAEKLLIEELERRHAQPKDYESTPKAEPTPDAEGEEKLKTLSPEELARLGREDKAGFFAALRPAAEAAEREYGVPASITLAQAALETGWGKHIIPGYNIFGIKGTGPAGTVAKGTWEVYDGKKVTITANFAKYHNFHEAVKLHGKLFHNGYYTKAMEQFAKDKDPFAFARNITGTYATDPSYGDKLSSIMRQYKLV